MYTPFRYISTPSIAYLRVLDRSERESCMFYGGDTAKVDVGSLAGFKEGFIVGDTYIIRLRRRIESNWTYA